MSSNPDDALASAAALAAERETRLRRIEDDLKNLKPKRKDSWEKFQVLTPLIAALAVAVVGYFLTGSVNNAIQRQQLQLSNVKEMREMLLELPTADPVKAEATGFTLGVFGRPAVPALMAALIAGGEARAPASEIALREIGFDDPAAVCGPVRKIIDDRKGRYSWLAHLSALKLIGDLGCTDARDSVDKYANALAAAQTDLKSFATYVSADPALDASAIGQLDKQTQRAIQMLRP